MQFGVIGLGALSLLLALFHLVYGGRDVAKPMLRADFEPVARATMHVCWHTVRRFGDRGRSV